MIGLQQARPPFVEFRQVAKHDMQRSLEVGYRVTKDVDMAFIMQGGSKDCLEIKAEDWLAQIKRKMIEGAHDAYPQDWVDGFYKKFEAWKAGQELPLNGTSVKEWPILSPAQAQNFIAMHVPTIEDVAAMTEEAIGRFVMSGRELRDKAREWIKTTTMTKDVMKENNELKDQLAKLAARLEALEKTPEPKKRGRPKLVKAA